MKSSRIFLTLCLVAPPAVAQAEESKREHTETNAAGTTVTTETSTDNSVGWGGTKKSTSDVKTVIDPKGLGNKLTSKSHVESKVQPNGDFNDSTKLVHGDGTKEIATNEKETSKNWMDSGKTTTTTRTHSVDPKGLLNKRETEVKETVVFNADGTQQKTVTKEVNGEKVYEGSTAP